MTNTIVPRDANNVAAGSVYTSGVGVIAAQGAAATTDSSGVTSAPITQARAAATVLTQASAAQTASSQSANLAVGQFTELAVDVDVTAVSGTTPSMTLFVERLGADGVWYQVWASSAITATGVTSTSIGAGLATNQSFGATIRLRWAITGTTPSFTMSISIIGK